MFLFILFILFILILVLVLRLRLIFRLLLLRGRGRRGIHGSQGGGKRRKKGKNGKNGKNGNRSHQEDQEESQTTIVHEDFCRSCEGGGELLCCDGCPAVYHFSCIKPRLKAMPDDGDDWLCGDCLRAQRRAFGKEADQDKDEDEDQWADLCVKCGEGGDLLCCDGPGCPGVYHLHCASPALRQLPTGDWFCLECVRGGATADDFEDGVRSPSLSSAALRVDKAICPFPPSSVRSTTAAKAARITSKALLD